VAEALPSQLWLVWKIPGLLIRQLCQSDCGDTRGAIGTLDTWINRGGAPETVLFKSYSSSVMRDIAASSDGNGGLIAFGRSSANVNNKGVVTQLNSAGQEIWRVQIDSPLGNTLIPHTVTTDGNRIIVLYERLPLHDWNIYAYDINGNGGYISETNIGYGLSSAKVVIDGTNLLISRVQPSVPLPAPIPFSSSMLYYASMISSDAPISVAPAISPEFVTMDAVGINVFGQGQYMKYGRDLSVLQAPQPLPQFDDIQSVVTIADKTYVAGTLSGALVLSELGNPAFRNTKGLAIGADKVTLHTDSIGNLYISIGNRFGLVNKATGDFVTINPAAISAMPSFISGANFFSVSGTSTIESLPLSRVQ